MATPAYLTISSSLIITEQGSKQIGPLTITAPTPLGQISEVTFAGAGNVTVTVPAGASAVVIVPPVANAVALTLKGVAGDTGIALDPNSPTVLAVATTLTTFVITAAGAVTGSIEISFI